MIMTAFLKAFKSNRGDKKDTNIIKSTLLSSFPCPFPCKAKVIAATRT